MTKQIEVNILGRDFTVSCPEDEEENLQKSISYLKHKVDEIQQSGLTIGVDKTIGKVAGMYVVLTKNNETTKGSPSFVLLRDV
jgi:cell division protein ZapA (FtsZ GTPase activity inhibitor)